MTRIETYASYLLPLSLDDMCLAVQKLIHTNRLSFPFKEPSRKLGTFFTMLVHHQTLAYSMKPLLARWHPSSNIAKTHGHTVIDVSNQGTEYQKDIISQFFVDRIRLSSCKKHQLSPVDTFQRGDYSFVRTMVEYALKHYGLTTEGLSEGVWYATKYTECTTFKPTIALDMFTLFQTQRVLDFSAGWGDRLLAALAHPSVKRYVATDPNQSLKPAHDQMQASFNPNQTTSVKILYTDINTSMDAIGTEMFDTILTSPPFFDQEVYHDRGAHQSISLFPDFSEWFVLFLCRAIWNTWNHLEVNGHLILHLSDIKNIHMCEPLILFCVSTLKSCLFVGPVGIKGDSEQLRPLWVFRKTSYIHPYRQQEAIVDLRTHFPLITRLIGFVFPVAR